jgi:acyl transferase domain-containing protein
LAPAGARRGHCVLGSVKTNVGHLDAAAGVAGFIKSVLALRHQEIPPTLHFTAPNAQIDLAASPFRVNTGVEAWPAGEGPARAGVSSFGIGGTNAHVILEAAPASTHRPEARAVHAFVVSARSGPALEAYASAVAAALVTEPGLDPADVAWSLQTGRQPFEHRMAVVASSTMRLSAALARGDADRGAARARSVVFMFPGQGSQVPGMATGIYRFAPVFRSTVDACSERLRAPLGLDLRDLLLARDATPELSGRLTQTSIAQPALFVVEYALAQQLIGWGVEPAATIGHSVGEYAAACVGGAIGLDDALLLVAERGRLMQQQPAGRMLAVRMAPDALAAVAGVSVAAINAPGLCVASGSGEAIGALARHCRAHGIDAHELQTSHAFHSDAMDAILDDFGAAVARARLSAPSIPWISNLTGEPITAAQATDPQYWVRHLRQPVLFSAGLASASRLPNPLLIEVGPGRVLATLANESLPADAAEAIPSMRQQRDRTPDDEVLLRALARMWVAGVPIRWEALDSGRERRRVSLPTYPFERQRYWIDAPGAPGAPDAARVEPATARPVDEWFYVPVWKSAATPAGVPGDRDGRTWLVFARDDDRIAHGLIDRLRGDGAVPIVVVPGGGFRREGDARYSVRPGEPGDYAALTADLRQRTIALRDLVHAWSGEASGHDEGFFGLLWLARALADDDGGDIRLRVLSSRMQPVGGEGQVASLQAALLGPVQVIPRELPSIGCRSIDYVEPRNRDAEIRVIELLYRELVSDAEEPLVAYRHHQRRVRALDRVALASRPADAPLRTGGHYLITGGLGGVGLVIAGHLARTCRARLTLVGRTAPPADDPRMATLRAIEEAGGQVWTAAADVADLDRLRDVVREAAARFGPVHGVIHAAGVAGGGLIALKGRADVEQVWRPKIDGARNLARLFEGGGLDFLVFMSSLTGVFGETGQVDYCAAGAVLDAMAHELRARGERVVCIDWDTWQEAGMAVSTKLPAALQGLRDEQLRFGICNADGIDALMRVLASDLTQVVVSTRDPQLRSRHEQHDAARLASELTAARASHARPALAVPFAAPISPQEQAICRLWQSLLGVDAVGIDDDFFELGGHSLLATQVLSRVRDQMGVRVSLGVFFERPTVAALASLVERMQIEAVLADVDRLSEEDVARQLSSAADVGDTRDPVSR